MPFNQLGFFFWTGAYIYTNNWVFIILAALDGLLVMLDRWENKKP